MTEKITKLERSVIFNRLVDQAGVPSWGRAKTVSADCGVSAATASGWLNGSLPRDSTSLIRCSEVYNIDIYEWVTGEKKDRSLSQEKLKACIELLRQYETDNQLTLRADKFSDLTIMIYEDESKGKFLLENAPLLLPKENLL